jgi:MraZ protein
VDGEPYEGATWGIGYMGALHGNYERSIDGKGRLILPAKLRAEFGETAFLTSHVDGCLALYDNQAMEEQRAEMRVKLKRGSQNDRMIARVWSFHTYEVTFDAQGRFPIPAGSREWAGLDLEVLVIGMFDRVELWSPARYDEKISAANLELLEGTNL